MGSIAAAESAASSSSSSSIKHRNSISSLAPSRLHLPPKPNSQIADKPLPAADADADLELAALGSSPSTSYISLKDLLPYSPTGIQSPTAGSTSNQSWSEISIRNRLVKQAAWAYLQPMASSPESAGSCFFTRIPITGCLDFFRHRVFPAVRRALSRLLGFFSFGRKNRSS